MPNFPKKQQQCLIPKYLLDYATDLQENHPDPSAEWGGGSGGSPIEAGTGIVITGDETKTISVDTEDVAMKTDIPTKTSELTNDSGFITGINSSDVITALGYTPGTSNFSGSYNDLENKPTNLVTTDGNEIITGGKTFENPITVKYDSMSMDQAQYKYDSINYTNPSYNITLQPNANSSGTIVIDLPEQSGTLALQSEIPTDVSDLYNDAGYITGITSSDVSSALGYTPYDASNPNGYITGINSSDVISALGYTPGTSNFSGSYNDLTDKPFIPTVNDSTVTLQVNGTTAGSFTTNQASASTINLSVPSGYNVVQIDLPTIGPIPDTGTITQAQADLLALDNTVLVFNNVYGWGYKDYFYKMDNGLRGSGENYQLISVGGNYVSDAIITFDTTNLTWTASGNSISGVTGTNDGTNWTSLTIGNTTKNIPSGGSTYTAGTGIDITGSTISVDNTVAMKTDIITSYNDLTDKPTIPTVNNNTITITQGGVTKGSFTLNQNTNQTIDVDDVPGMIGEEIFSITPTSGTATYSINLSKDITQYDYIEIYFNDNDDTIRRFCSRFQEPTVGNKITITTFLNTSTPRVYTKNTVFEIATTTSLTLVTSSQQRVGNNEATTVSVVTNQCHCRPYKIIGYKQNSAPIVIPNFEYANGDTFVNSNYMSSTGYISSGQKELTFTIIVPKLLTNITSVTVNKLECLLRGVGGYVNGSSNIDYVGQSGYTINTYIAAPNAVTISVIKSTTYSSSTNNTPVNVAFVVNGLQLTFNS